MNRELFLDASQDDPRRNQNTDYQNDLIDEAMGLLDTMRNSVGGDDGVADDLARIARFMTYGCEPSKSPRITEEDVEWLFKQETGETWNFKLDDDPPEDEWR